MYIQAGRAPAVGACMQARLRHQREEGESRVQADCSPAFAGRQETGALGLEKASAGEQGALPSGRLLEPGRRRFAPSRSAVDSPSRLAYRTADPSAAWRLGGDRPLTWALRSRRWPDGSALGFGRLQSAAASSAVGAEAESRSTIGPPRRVRMVARLTGRPKVRSLYRYRMGKLNLSFDARIPGCEVPPFGGRIAVGR